MAVNLDAKAPADLTSASAFDFTDTHEQYTLWGAPAASASCSPGIAG